MEGLSLSGSSLALNFDLGSATTVGGSVNDLLIVTNLTLSGGNTNMVNFNAMSGSLAQGVPYTLIRYTSCGAPDGPVTTLATPPSHFIYTFNNDTANSRITVTITGNPFNLVWKGDGVTNAWDITTTPNWLNGVTPIVYFDGDNATFNDTGYNTPAINVTTTVKPTTVTVNATKDYVFSGSGKISGGAKLLKSNSGNLTLLTPNDFSAGGNLSGSGLVNVGNGGGTGNLGHGQPNQQHEGHLLPERQHHLRRQHERQRQPGLLYASGYADCNWHQHLHRRHHHQQRHLPDRQ